MLVKEEQENIIFHWNYCEVVCSDIATDSTDHIKLVRTGLIFALSGAQSCAAVIED